MMQENIGAPDHPPANLQLSHEISFSFDSNLLDLMAQLEIELHLSR